MLLPSTAVHTSCSKEAGHRPDAHSSSASLPPFTLTAAASECISLAATRPTLKCIILWQARRFLSGSKWQPVPSDIRRISLPVSAQPTTRSRSPCVSDMSCTGAPATGRRSHGARRTKGNRAAPCTSHSCAETHMPSNDCATENSGSGSVGCTVKCRSGVAEKVTRKSSARAGNCQ